MNGMHMVTTLVLELTSSAPGGTIPNPGAKTPGSLSGAASDIIGYVKWGVIIVIGLAGLVGVGMIAGGKIFGHHGAGQKGVVTLVAAVIGAAILPFMIPFLNSVA